MLRTLSLFALLLLLGACGGETTPATPEAPADTARVVALPTGALPSDADGPLVVYTGREESAVRPLVEMFREKTGIEVEVRYAADAELLEMLVEEGDRSPADVLWSNATGVLGMAVERNLLTLLPDSMRVLPGQYVPASGMWVPVAARFRVLAYAPGRVDEASLPTSVMSLPEVEALNNRIGWVPASSSFHDFLTAIRVGGGEDAASDWLDVMQASGAKTYASHASMLNALTAGEIDLALTDHSSILGANANGAALALHSFLPSDPGNLGMVTGAGVLDTSSRQRSARRFISFLLSSEAQTLAVETTREIPLVAGVPAPQGFVPFETAIQLAPRLDVERLRDVDATLTLLRDKGLL